MRKGSDDLTDDKPRLVGGIGEINFGKQYRQGNRVYDADAVAMCLHSQPVDNAGGNSYLYLVDENTPKGSGNLTRINEELFEAKPFKYVSLFSGIGGFEQALNKLGGTCVLASEIDKFANQAYEVLYEHPTAGDITKIAAKDVPDHDLLVGGFPCQAFSVAGKRLGFEDTRGTLFFEVARLAKEKQPKVVLLENVKGLVGHDKGRTLDTIVKTLNDIGYTVDFEVLNSKYFGVPQNRERIFIIAVRDDLIEPEPWVIEGNTVVPKGKRRISEYEGVKTFNFDWPEQKEVTTKLRDILEPIVDEKYYLSDDKTAKLVAQLEAQPNAENIPLEGLGRLAGLRNREDRVFAYQGDKKRSTAQENIYLRDGAIADSVTVGHMPKYIDSEPQMLGHVDIKGHDSIKRVYSTEHVGPTLTTMGGGHREPKIAEEVRPVLTPDRENKRQNGRRFKDNDEEAFTLTSQDRHGVALGNPPKYRIRKLTPRECWRLQGFSDEAHDAVKAAGISDSQRYKMAGNAVSVPVISAIGKRLLPYISVSSTEK